MTSSKPVRVQSEVDVASCPEDRPSRWFLLEVEANSEAEEALLWLLTDSLSQVMPGIHYSAQCNAQSMAEALAAFAHLGCCERYLHLRLMMQRILD